MQGYLTKPNKNFGSKKRFFVLDRMTLSYYENEAKGQKLADIVLNAQTRVSAVGAQQINIDNVQVSAKSSAKTSYVLLCDSPPPQRDQWIAALTHACGIEEAERLKAQREAEERARLEAEEAERRRLEAEEAERRRREAEEAERRRREAEEAERRRREAEEAERRRSEAEEAERRRREAEDLALWEAQEAERLRLLALQQAVVEDIPEPALDLKPRVETSQAVYKVFVALQLYSKCFLTC
jgi:flagellar biosynthesis GTPase FlhF